MLKRPSITFWATLFVAVVCLALVAIDGWRSWNARAQRLLDMEQLSSNLARSMAYQANDTIKAADVGLADIVERIEADGVGTPALERVHQRMVAQVQQLPQLAGLFVFDDTGKWLVNSRPELTPSMNNADREYFIYHRDRPGRAPYIGVPLVSRSTGQWIIPVSRRINRPDGSFAGVALATLDVDYFRHFYQSFDIGQRGAVALLSNDGRMLLRRPFSEAFIGKDVRDTTLFQAYERTRSGGSAFLLSPNDGEERFNSFRALPNYPLFVTAALSKEEMLEHWRRDTFAHSLGVVLLAAMLGLFGKRLVDQIHRRVDAEAALRKARDALESANRTLERQAMQDGLTGLANRRQFDVTLGNEFSRAMRYQHALAFVMLDVDYFKQYNDVYGHQAGDDCLRTVSGVIRALTPRRPGDLSARYGGEEIGILLPNTDMAGAHAVAERIRQAIEELRIVHTGSAVGVVTLSAGVAVLVPQRGKHLSVMLVEAADQALYMAKSAGRNRVCDAAEEKGSAAGV
ncbi:sensor domain-containing diguanylate cyclase [Oxalobacteraceae bacterium]|nr:sensor domain-containing diguanylate cyclase [Oxalobacteraceae bacterium]